LPALDISWFNTKTQQVEVARLPSVTVKALASGEVAPPQPSTLPGEAAAEQPVASAPVAVNGDARFWQWLSAFLGLGWLLTVALFYARRAKQLPKSVPASAGQPADAGTDKSLKRACWENNPQAAKQALLQWGKANFGADSLGSIAPLCVEQLRDEILRLNQHLYSGQQQAWKGEDLWQAFSKAGTRQRVGTNRDDGLEPLFKL
jgi:hypothetical protein